MTEQYFKLTLEKDLLAVCKKCIEQQYIYEEGWDNFVLNIANIRKFECDTKLIEVNFNIYRGKNGGDYKKMALMDMFEFEFKKYIAMGEMTFDL